MNKNDNNRFNIKSMRFRDDILLTYGQINSFDETVISVDWKFNSKEKIKIVGVNSFDKKIIIRKCDQTMPVEVKLSIKTKSTFRCNRYKNYDIEEKIL